MRAIQLRSFPQRQKGVILFIALIVLVAMTLAGIGMVRSFDTGNAAAGNLGFKQMSLNSGEAGIQVAYQWLVAQAGTPNLINSNPAQGYFSSRPVTEPDWGSSSAWTNAVVLNAGAADAAGNVVSYVIHRMCTLPNTAYNGTNAAMVQNQCAMAAPTAAGAGGSMGVGNYSFSGAPQVYYRITARSVGPRNTASYIQAMVALSN